ncbi:MAG TPA: hypothetical protein VLM05_02465 [Mycobacteriales bacterium]|nr:hypothetical protein [Mycobacteriales bacterium]
MAEPTAPDPVAEERATLRSELDHWSAAVRALADLDAVAPPAAWSQLESYLGRSVRTSLAGTATRLARQADRVGLALAAAEDAADLLRVRRELLALRRRYVQVETVVEFFADAVATRADSRLGAALRGLDALAVDSMERVLRPLGIDVPPVLTYLDKGLGASILRSGARLWDASLSPVAAIKVTHHNLWQPTSLVHETGHQVAHLTGWDAELATALHDALRPVAPLAARWWRSWAGEVAADVYAFALLGFAPLPALATVVDGSTPEVFRMFAGDPHPFGWIRVQFNAALCRSWFGAGPWDRIARVWARRHPAGAGDPEAVEVATQTMRHLGVLADVCTRTPMRAFGGRPLAALADPRLVSPTALTALARSAGPALYTSSYLRRLESMRILAWIVLDAGTSGPRPVPAQPLAEAWLRRMGGERAEAA